MPTEFQHGLFDGGGGAGLADYWNMMSASKYLGGGFIWALLDAGIKRPDTGQIDTAGNQAPDGIVGPYRQREASFYAIKQIWSPIEVTRNSDETFLVENHYSFLNASQCRFTWQLRQFPDPDKSDLDSVVVSQGVADSPAIPPGDHGILKLNLPKTSESRGCAGFARRGSLWAPVMDMGLANGQRGSFPFSAQCAGLRAS